MAVGDNRVPNTPSYTATLGAEVSRAVRAARVYGHAEAVFYGAFKGRAKIAELIDDWFYRTASDFRWDMHAPISDGETLYARYTFSYRSNLPEANGARVMFEGVSIMKLRGGQIADYHEVANTAPAFVDMNFAPERIAKIVAKQGAELKARPEMARHLK